MKISNKIARHCHRVLYFLLAIAVPLLLPAQALAQPVTISAASSLTDAFQTLAKGFEAVHPGAKVRLNFAASGVLLQQLAQGAPVDVFASADQDTMDRAVKQKWVDAATRRDFAANELVLVEPATGGVALRTLQDLYRPAVRRIAVGKPATVPVGRYTRQALESAGLWAALAPRMVQADNVRQVLDYVARGEVEAGFVYRTDAVAIPAKVRVVLVVAGHDRVRYPVAVATDAPQQALAQAFAAYLLAPAAQEILARHGFGKP